MVPEISNSPLNNFFPFTAMHRAVGIWGIKDANDEYLPTAYSLRTWIINGSMI
jgi:hypothetical protein